MKIFQYIMMIAILAMGMACEKNQEVPDHEVVGEAYATAVSFSVSEDEPRPGDEITVSLTYANYTAAPVASVTFQKEVDDEAIANINVIDESGAALDAQITHSFTYMVPDAEEIVLYAVLASAEREFPQIERVILEVEQD
jgi:hypothetical protein